MHYRSNFYYNSSIGTQLFCHSPNELLKIKTLFSVSINRYEFQIFHPSFITKVHVLFFPNISLR